MTKQISRIGSDPNIGCIQPFKTSKVRDIEIRIGRRTNGYTAQDRKAHFFVWFKTEKPLKNWMETKARKIKQTLTDLLYSWLKIE